MIWVEYMPLNARYAASWIHLAALLVLEAASWTHPDALLISDAVSWIHWIISQQIINNKMRWILLFIL